MIVTFEAESGGRQEPGMTSETPTRVMGPCPSGPSATAFPGLLVCLTLFFLLVGSWVFRGASGADRRRYQHHRWQLGPLCHTPAPFPSFPRLLRLRSEGSCTHRVHKAASPGTHSVSPGYNLTTFSLVACLVSGFPHSWGVVYSIPSCVPERQGD